jgi:hypothetical protein
VNGLVTISWGDTIAPTVTLTTPPQGATYTLGESVLADFACDDETDGSGLKSCAGTIDGVAIDIGAAIDTATVGSKTFKVTAADNQGNSTVVTHSYSVAYAFDGFFAPIDNGGVYNSVKAGQIVPVRFSLSGDLGLDVLAAGSPSSRPVACASDNTSDPVEETLTAGASGLSYANGHYTYAWKTDETWTGCRMLTVTLTDGVSHTALFKFTR